MNRKYTVRMVTLTPKKAREKVTEFKVDPTKKNRFILVVDDWTKIKIDVQAKKWWEFWK